MTGPVLGLCSFTHDSAAALIVDGQIVGLVEEERRSGVKHDKSYPRQGVDWLLAKAALRPGDVSRVALHFRHGLYRRAAPGALAHLLHPATARRAIPRARSLLTVAGNEHGRLELLRRRFPKLLLRSVGLEVTATVEPSVLTRLNRFSLASAGSLPSSLLTLALPWPSCRRGPDRHAGSSMMSGGPMPADREHRAAGCRIRRYVIT